MCMAIEENIYEPLYVEELVENDALTHEEALFLQGYNLEH